MIGLGVRANSRTANARTSTSTTSLILRQTGSEVLSSAKLACSPSATKTL